MRPRPGPAGGVAGRQALVAVGLVFLLGIMIGVAIGIALAG